MHWLHMHDVTAVLGQDNATSIVLKGLPNATKNVALHCSHPDELLPHPDALVSTSAHFPDNLPLCCTPFPWPLPLPDVCSVLKMLKACQEHHSRSA